MLGAARQSRHERDRLPALALSRTAQRLRADFGTLKSDCQRVGEEARVKLAPFGSLHHPTDQLEVQQGIGRRPLLTPSGHVKPTPFWHPEENCFPFLGHRRPKRKMSVRSGAGLIISYLDRSAFIHRTIMSDIYVCATGVIPARSTCAV